MKAPRLTSIIVLILSLGGRPMAAPLQPAVTYDEQGFLRVEGKRFFVIGAYDPPREWGAKELAAAGFNVLRVGADRKTWDEAHDAGLRVWHSFGSLLSFGPSDAEDKASKLAQRVEALAGHPALLFWESTDEPAWSDDDPARARFDPESLARGYRELRRLDPRHPVYLNHAPRNTVETLRQYNAACDIVCADIYPIIPPGLRRMFAITPDGRHGDLPNQTPSCVGEYVQKMRRVGRRTAARPVFIVLQGFAWEALRKEGERDPKMIRYPTYAETRFMAFDAIINGANGILYWGLRHVPTGHPFLDDLARVTREMNELTPAITGTTVAHEIERRYHEMGSTIAAGVEVLVRERPDGRRVYFTANTSVDPARVTFSNLPARTRALRPGEPTEMVDYLSGDYDGLEVRIFEEPQ